MTAATKSRVSAFSPPSRKLQTAINLGLMPFEAFGKGVKGENPFLERGFPLACLTKTIERNKIMLNIDELKFDEKGLIPAVVIDAVTKKLLTVAYMNKESLAITMEKGLTCFYSRSRQELWLKGETSGNYQHVVSITADCDKDALEVLVLPDGPACHLGTTSCFENPVYESEENHAFSLEGLMALIEGRKSEKKEGSYTTYLFEKGIDKILKKVGEECTEVIIAGKADDKKETVYEIADLCYHVMVLMVEMGIPLDDIYKELASRHVIDKKVKQEKMT